MKNNIQTISIAALLLTFSMLSFAEKTLCKEGEYTYISCQLTNNKYISLCSASKSGELLSYRYGSPKHIEMEITKPKRKFSIKFNQLSEDAKIRAKEGQWSSDTGKNVTINIGNNHVNYEFSIGEYQKFSEDNIEDLLPSSIVSTLIDDERYINTSLRAYTKKDPFLFNGQCKQGVSFQNLFQLK